MKMFTDAGKGEIKEAGWKKIINDKRNGHARCKKVVQRSVKDHKAIRVHGINGGIFIRNY